jgi:hypothetical protein
MPHGSMEGSLRATDVGGDCDAGWCTGRAGLGVGGDLLGLLQAGRRPTGRRHPRRRRRRHLLRVAAVPVPEARRQQGRRRGRRGRRRVHHAQATTAGRVWCRALAGQNAHRFKRLADHLHAGRLHGHRPARAAPTRRWSTERPPRRIWSTCARICATARRAATVRELRRASMPLAAVFPAVGLVLADGPVEQAGGLLGQGVVIAIVRICWGDRDPARVRCRGC